MNDKILELESELMVIDVPVNTIEFKATFKVYVNGELIDVSNTYTMKDIREGIQYAEDNLFEEEARYCITEKGLKYLEEIGL